MRVRSSGWLPNTVLVVLFSLYGGAQAASVSCSVSTSGVVFSSYSTATKSVIDSTGTLTVTCSGSGSISLSLNLNGGNTNSCTSREMRASTANLGYQIYRDSGRLNRFCDGADRLDITFNLGSGNNTSTQTQNVSMYGRVFAGQNPAATGSYRDALNVILKQGGGTLASTTAEISGSVSNTCSLSPATLNFGNYNPWTGANATGNLEVTCSNGTPYKITMSGGQNQSDGTRRMAGPNGGRLVYLLFSDAAQKVSWGDGAALGAAVSGTGDGNKQQLIIYGRIPEGQISPPIGQYSDSTIVTITY